MDINWNNFNYVDYLNFKDIEISDLPHDISISTMCASCKLNTKIIISNLLLISDYKNRILHPICHP
jgi:hypothetical protein